MIFRTEIETPSKQPFNIRHEQGIVMLGSCFTDNIGELLERDGFDVVHNPMGTLYNPASIYNVIRLALTPDKEIKLNIKTDSTGKAHCLDFATKYTDESYEALVNRTIGHLKTLGEKIRSASTVILTLGTAYVFAADGVIVGNCHKFPAHTFTRSCLSISDVTQYLRAIIDLLPESANVIFTVSPIRHTADGLHGNQLSKSTLLLGVNNQVDNSHIHYFPSYEIMIDDLRDYRFYGADMKHPSPTAVEYIYETFAKYYFTPQTVERATVCRKESLRKAHRPILQQ